MNFTNETPTNPGWFLWRTTKCQSGWAARIERDQYGVMRIETDGERDTLDSFVREQAGNKLEWCRLVDAEEVEAAWNEAYEWTTFIPDESTGAKRRRWINSRSKKVMEGVE